MKRICPFGVTSTVIGEDGRGVMSHECIEDRCMAWRKMVSDEPSEHGVDSLGNAWQSAIRKTWMDCARCVNPSQILVE